MKRAIYLFIALTGFLLSSCDSNVDDDVDELDFRQAFYGQYQGVRSGTYSDIAGGSDSYAKIDTFNVSEYIPALDSVWIINNYCTTKVRAFIDRELTWNSLPWDGGTSHRSYFYRIEGNKLTVKYRKGGSGGGWDNTFTGIRQ